MRLLVGLLYIGLAWAGESRPPLFQVNDPLQFSLTADLSELIAARDKSLVEKGTITYFDPLLGKNVELKVEVSVRGNNSLRKEECTFPKLKILFSREKELKGTIFEGTTWFRLGTHCGDRADQDTTTRGRLANQKAPVRENLAYRIQSQLGLPARLSRLAEVTYVSPSTGSKFTRSAHILEEVEFLATRLGGKIRDYRETSEQLATNSSSDKEEVFTNAVDLKIDLEMLAGTVLFEALIGNADWALKVSEDEDTLNTFSNMKIVEFKDGRKTAVAYDYDIALAVTGVKGPLLDLASERIAKARKLLPKDVMEKYEKLFVEARPELMATIERSNVDELGKEVFRSHAEAFFTALKSSPLKRNCNDQLKAKN